MVTNLDKLDIYGKYGYGLSKEVTMMTNNNDPWAPLHRNQRALLEVFDSRALADATNRIVSALGTAADRFLREPIFLSSDSKQFVGNTPLGQLKAAAANAALQGIERAIRSEIRKRRNRQLRKNLELMLEIYRALEGHSYYAER